VSQLKTKSTTKSLSDIKTRKQVTDTQNLIGKLLNYEETARVNKIDFNSSRFKMLTASERDFLRAELVCDYIRLSAGNTEMTQGYFDAALFDFCTKICDVQIPTFDLMGTYLASLDVIKEDKLEKRLPGLTDNAKRTIHVVLQTAVEMLAHKTTTAANKKSKIN
jgi:hypothetical protein